MTLADRCSPTFKYVSIRSDIVFLYIIRINICRLFIQFLNRQMFSISVFTICTIIFTQTVKHLPYTGGHKNDQVRNTTFHFQFYLSTPLAYCSMSIDFHAGATFEKIFSGYNSRLLQTQFSLQFLVYTHSYLTQICKTKKIATRVRKILNVAFEMLDRIGQIT